MRLFGKTRILDLNTSWYISNFNEEKLQHILHIWLSELRALSGHLKQIAKNETICGIRRMLLAYWNRYFFITMNMIKFMPDLSVENVNIARSRSSVKVDQRVEMSSNLSWEEYRRPQTTPATTRLFQNLWLAGFSPISTICKHPSIKGRCQVKDKT